ncbi:unnamed protein product [Dracunculus medinensis]|uniref:Biogenesis of lysosome-related organelles complex 1 subunit CNL1 n=1 Tax=Dracunculus medinensis TaxID=318479 RepID=A0A0N4UN77_DRAME|nr:unnamed protein product [Dracunculus medinensis]
MKTDKNLMKKEENEGPSTGIVEKDIRDFAKNVETCLNSFAYEAFDREKLANRIEDCLVAAEELGTLNKLVSSDIKTVNKSVATINTQIGQLDVLFRNIDRLVEYIQEKKRLVNQFESELDRAEKLLNQR